MLKRLYTINFIDAFIVGAMTVLVPLLMLDRGIGIATIGIVFAVAPLAKAAVRLVGAGMADSLGDRVVYILFSAFNFLQSAAYMVSTTATGFAAGKLLDGARESTLWSVVRPSLMAASPEKKHFAFVDLLSGRYVYNAIGSLAVGALFAFGGFELPLAAMVALSAYIVFSSMKLKDFHKPIARAKLSDFTPLGRSRKFYEIAGAFTIGSALYSASFYMLLPLYFSMQGFTLGEIGMFYAVYFLIIGAVLHLLSHHRIGTARAAAGGVAIYCIGLAGVVAAPHALIPAFFLLMAFGDAGLAMLWEELNYIGGRESRKRATDLSLLVTPSYFGNVVSMVACGAIAAAFGFAPVFALLALSEIIFGAWCMRLASMED
ncbi:MAG: MFS transporter [Candidatus Micrarchaeota archaeon]|nr:MFS transporter [Candidatus Micrarchaeota archaeon]